MPRYQCREIHEIQINAPQEVIYDAIRSLEFSDSKMIKTLLRLRGMPVSDLSLLGFIEEARFSVLDEKVNEEILFGFYARTGVEKVVDPMSFADNLRYPLKMTWNFRVEIISEKHVRVSTETRALCNSRFALMLFVPYWYMVRPFSGLIRKIMLNKIRRESEVISSRI